ncbi:MAG: response regulator transcription factor [Burkholderiales bacterium]|nr:response regulator transcription factor [Burkholderiales bacterium]
MSAIRVLLADDHALVLAGIRALVEELGDTQIVAEANNGRDAVALAKQHKPDLVIMDISMHELNGIEATAQIMAEVPSTKVLILSMHTTEDFVRRAIKAGAAGYLVKDSAPLDLKMAIAAVLRDEIYLSPRVSKHVVAGFLHGKPHQNESSMDALTARQREILQMIAEGKSTKQIAFQLDVSIKTVETHRAALMERLDIHDVAGLVLYAVRHGVISVDRADS